MTVSSYSIDGRIYYLNYSQKFLIHQQTTSRPCSGRLCPRSQGSYGDR